MEETSTQLCPLTDLELSEANYHPCCWLLYCYYCLAGIKLGTKWSTKQVYIAPLHQYCQESKHCWGSELIWMNWLMTFHCRTAFLNFWFFTDYVVALMCMVISSVSALYICILNHTPIRGPGLLNGNHRMQWSLYLYPSRHYNENVIGPFDLATNSFGSLLYSTPRSESWQSQS